MTKFSLLSQGWQLKLVGSVAIVGTLFTAVGESVLAQIVPDNTLGAEGSVVTPNVNIQGIPSNRIDGGAPRGANLFHSFQEFNVGEGRGAYFANPIGIENILTRVTGGNPSNIFGRLGVLGEANLFLLNPHGIVFGANSSLDIQGSFVATTAERIQLGDSGYFSASQPQTSSLLSVNPGALFFNAVANQPTSIINRGNLSTGKHLTLSAGNLDLQGQLLSGGDLTLQAQDTVKVRDTVATPFLAQSGGNLTIIGNGGIDILALNHPTQTPFVSGENLSLISDGIISGDARFSSGGSFSIKSVSRGLANFVSYYDPIISAVGDVDVAANYTGTSLLVEATGNIQFQGDINITGPDTSTLPPGPDTATLSTTSALIMRSGQSTLAYGGVNSGSVPNYGTEAVPAGITIGGNVVVQPFNGVGGIVNLTAASGNVSTQLISTNGQQNFNYDNDTDGGVISISAQDGSITTGDLLSYSYSGEGNAAEGGAITLTAANDIYITGDLDSSSTSFSFKSIAGQGGAINITAVNGSITTGSLNSSSFSGGGIAGQGGAINITAANDIYITSYLNSSSFSAYGNNTVQGGAINITAANGSITTGNLDSDWYSGSSSGGGNAGQGGAINITAANGSITTGYLDSSSSSADGNAGQGGAINITAANDIYITGSLDSSWNTSDGNAGQGGAINITAANDIYITGSLASSSFSSDSGNAGQGGAINITAANDIYITGNLFNSFSYSDSSNAGQGGAINITAANGSITIGNLFNSFSYSEDGNAADGGAINITAANDIYITGDLNSFSYSKSGNAANGGAISLIARGGDISGQENQSTVLGSFSISRQGTAGNGGNVALTGKNNVSNLEILTLSSSSQSGKVQVTGLGDLLLTNTNILTSKQVTVPAPTLSGAITLDAGGKGQSGDVAVTSLGNLTFNNSSIQSDTKGSDPAGNVAISSPGLVTFNNSQIISNTSSTGQAGSITLKAPEVQLDSSSRLSAQTSSSGSAGNITLQPYDGGQTLSVLFQEGAQISASTSGSGKGGNLIVTAPEAVTIRGSGLLAVETTGAGAAGKLTIDTQRLTISDGATVSASTSSTNPNGIGGNITINATQSFDLSNGASLRAQSNGAAPAGNITINTGNLTARDVDIATSSEQSSGGGISITGDQIRLWGDSDITTNVDEGTGGGGNIYLKAGSILAFNDSDILAFSRDGRGGNITLDTPAFFGQNYRPAPRNTNPDTFDNNNRADVNASGAVSGIITTPDTTFIQNSLTPLPDNQINTDHLLANSCIVRRNQPTRGTFFITGTGGLPQRPGDAQMSTFPTVDIETLPTDSTPSNTEPNRPWQKGDPIVEPQGVYRLPNGKLVLSRECP